MQALGLIKSYVKNCCVFLYEPLSYRIINICILNANPYSGLLEYIHCPPPPKKCHFYNGTMLIFWLVTIVYKLQEMVIVIHYLFRLGTNRNRPQCHGNSL